MPRLPRVMSITLAGFFPALPFVLLTLVLLVLLDKLMGVVEGKKSELGPADKTSRSLGLTMVTEERCVGPSVLYK